MRLPRPEHRRPLLSARAARTGCVALFSLASCLISVTHVRAGSRSAETLIEIDTPELTPKAWGDLELAGKLFLQQWQKQKVNLITPDPVVKIDICSLIGSTTPISSPIMKPKETPKAAPKMPSVFKGNIPPATSEPETKWTRVSPEFLLDD